MQSIAATAGLRRIEAARYALLRRLAMAMRHQMVVHLQPIGMVTELLDRRLRQPQPDLDRVGESMQKIQGFVRAATGASLDAITWIAPEAGRSVALAAGVGETLALLRSHFSFRGVTLGELQGEGASPVPRSTIRTLLPAVLFALADEADAPAQVSLYAEDTDDGLRLDVRLVPAQADAALPDAEAAPYRHLAWDEVELLARDEGAGLTHQAGEATLLLPVG